MAAIQPTYHELFEAHKCCVIIPTYNNGGTLLAVIAQVQTYTKNIIVVNDGATDQTAAILHDLPGIQLVSYAPNRGKGWALRQGFKKALQQGYDFAITLDADGQHFAEDLPVFLERLERGERNSLIVGARNLQQENMPGKNTFANKFSNFWFYVETFQKMPDTQSGYRLYPLHRMRKMRFVCRKYEFEIEVLVRCAWKGIHIDWVPVKVYYPPPGERVSHFRPFRDFSRISVLNTVLVLIAFLYIHPRNFLIYFSKKDNWKKIWQDEMLRPNESNMRKALSAGVGVCIGILPIWGLQMLTAILVSTLFKLNKGITFLCCHISFPPMIPFVIFGSFLMGRIWVKGGTDLLFSKGLTLQTVRENLLQYITGSITLALLAGTLTTLIIYLVLAVFRKQAGANA
ncbi:Glycosyltransferase involved in cell wall bisynthesis [Chitinophaga costaii]|uniref:Glycosyltransferase involved in cell wall bisynthesis n=1 Tax=Chitinophaga costaii TaxID=1335309 RepID=A0A1C3ZH25_9BACT|nr:DUF2062 domain-containing protein [Chitinophaga costaii]PUZ30366.1 DUF2062 domain-containing protein [Chitinophaga costaii]SCB81550.1 Glycosyltransferase involved in cell wall bisynthesis [Chitinophaga costaii]